MADNDDLEQLRAKVEKARLEAELARLEQESKRRRDQAAQDKALAAEPTALNRPLGCGSSAAFVLALVGCPSLFPLESNPYRTPPEWGLLEVDRWTASRALGVAAFAAGFGYFIWDFVRHARATARAG